LSWLNARWALIQQPPAMLMRTYQVYLTDSDGNRRFEPLLSTSDAELLADLRKRLAAERLEEIRIEYQGRVLFTLVQ
jgi:hypothetical protein